MFKGEWLLHSCVGRRGCYISFEGEQKLLRGSGGWPKGTDRKEEKEEKVLSDAMLVV